MMRGLGVSMMLLAACGYGSQEPSYPVESRALVHAPLPSARSGRAMSEDVEIGASGAVMTSDSPERTQEQQATILVPRASFSADGRLRLGRNVDLGVVSETGIRPGRAVVGESDLKVPDGPALGLGGGMRVATGVGNGLHAAFALDVMHVWLPAAQEVAGQRTDGRARSGMFRLSFTPTWVADRWSVYGDLAVRTHHYTRPSYTRDPDPDLAVTDAGYLIATIGAEVEVARRVRMSAFLATPFRGQDVATYSPFVGLGLRLGIPLPRRPQEAESVERQAEEDECKRLRAAMLAEQSPERRLELVRRMPARCHR